MMIKKIVLLDMLLCVGMSYGAEFSTINFKGKISISHSAWHPEGPTEPVSVPIKCRLNKLEAVQWVVAMALRGGILNSLSPIPDNVTLCTGTFPDGRPVVRIAACAGEEIVEETIPEDGHRKVLAWTRQEQGRGFLTTIESTKPLTDLAMGMALMAHKAVASSLSDEEELAVQEALCTVEPGDAGIDSVKMEYKNPEGSKGFKVRFKAEVISGDEAGLRKRKREDDVDV